MDKNTILNYVMNSPENTNPNVLGSMLNGMGGDSTGNNFIIPVTVSYDVDTGKPISYTTEVPFSEAYNAHISGKNVIMDVSPEGGYSHYFLSLINSTITPEISAQSLYFASIKIDSSFGPSGPTFYVAAEALGWSGSSGNYLSHHEATTKPTN